MMTMMMMVMVLTAIMVVVMVVDLPQRISPALNLGSETVRQPAATLARGRPSARSDLGQRPSASPQRIFKYLWII